MSETERFLSALRFLTIVPTPASDAAPQPDWLARSLKYFPLVGIGIGAASAAVFLLAGQIWGPVIASLLAVIASAVITVPCTRMASPTLLTLSAAAGPSNGGWRS